MKEYDFRIQWNTGDMYWDNEPEVEEFSGSIDELIDKLGDYTLPCTPEEFKERLLIGEEIYDDGEET